MQDDRPGSKRQGAQRYERRDPPGSSSWGGSRGRARDRDRHTSSSGRGGSGDSTAAGTAPGMGDAIGSGASQLRGGWNEAAAGSGRPSDADWTANDDWLDALGLGRGPSKTEDEASSARTAADDANASASSGVMEPGLLAQSGSEILGGDSRQGESSTDASSNGGRDDDWFFDGMTRGQAAVFADPTRAREGTEQTSDRRKAANSGGAAGGWGLQRGRGRDGRGWRGGRRGADGVHDTPSPEHSDDRMGTPANMSSSYHPQV